MSFYPDPPHDDTPPFREFNTSNHLLGDRAALDAAWDRDGHWFFRNVLASRRRRQRHADAGDRWRASVPCAFTKPCVGMASERTAIYRTCREC